MSRATRQIAIRTVLSARTYRLANALRKERDRLGLTQAALAEQVGVSRKTINTVENRRVYSFDSSGTQACGGAGQTR
ncbi:helix-turn-helix transcriptional regulator [Novosphingopyxis baekryungensis]|uniref:helix-turn-helix transcriptional regulator n=1 Tax=Novosphingopyxis baekryungensis TaxID=279369 RepID=UPI003CCC1D22